METIVHRASIERREHESEPKPKAARAASFLIVRDAQRRHAPTVFDLASRRVYPFQE
jgi:hypothetical protein